MIIHRDICTFLPANLEFNTLLSRSNSARWLINSFAVSAWPLQHAIMRGVRSSESTTSTSAPAWIKSYIKTNKKHKLKMTKNVHLCSLILYNIWSNAFVGFFVAINVNKMLDLVRPCRVDPSLLTLSTRLLPLAAAICSAVCPSLLYRYTPALHSFNNTLTASF